MFSKVAGCKSRTGRRKLNTTKAMRDEAIRNKAREMAMNYMGPTRIGTMDMSVKTFRFDTYKREALQNVRETLDFVLRCAKRALGNGANGSLSDLGSPDSQEETIVFVNAYLHVSFPESSPLRINRESDVRLREISEDLVDTFEAVLDAMLIRHDPPFAPFVEALVAYLLEYQDWTPPAELVGEENRVLTLVHLDLLLCLQGVMGRSPTGRECLALQAGMDALRTQIRELDGEAALEVAEARVCLAREDRR